MGSSTKWINKQMKIYLILLRKSTTLKSFSLNTVFNQIRFFICPDLLACDKTTDHRQATDQQKLTTDLQVVHQPTDHWPTNKCSTDPLTTDHRPSYKCSTDPPTTNSLTHQSYYNWPPTLRLAKLILTESPLDQFFQ